MIARRFAVMTVALTGAVAWAGCPEVLSHIYSGGLYDPDANCIEPGLPIDPALAGPPEDSGPCDAICIANEGGRVFISGQCPPYPTTFDLDTGSLPACKAAFEALAECRFCRPEGGGVLIEGDACVEASAFDAAGGGTPDAGRDAKDEDGKDADHGPEKDARVDVGSTGP